MGNSLMNYLNKRMAEEGAIKQRKAGTEGPVITISREVGCNGIKLANAIAARLNKQRPSLKWKVLSKEIFYESAKELDLDPEKVRKIFKKTDKYTFENILKAFGDKRYKSDVKIVNTVRDVIYGLAVDGFNIIVGRAGHIIASEIENALHVRLTAPMDYRVNTIVTNNHLSRPDALKFIEKVEAERMAFRKALREDNLREELFDLTINRASFNDEQAAELIEIAFEKKRIQANVKDKMDFY